MLSSNLFKPMLRDDDIYFADYIYVKYRGSESFVVFWIFRNIINMFYMYDNVF